MREITTKTNERLEKFKELYTAALIQAEGNRERLCRHMNQYLGSDEIDGSSERASVVRNITYEIIESQIDADIPPVKVDTSCYSTKRDRNARAVERLCSALRSRLPFAELNDRDERYTYIYGGSVFYVEWDSTPSDNAGEGGVKVHLLSPLDFIPQPNVSAVEDMEYCFLHFTTTRGELMSRYGADERELALADCEYAIAEGDGLGDTVALIIAFYKDEEGRCGRFVFSGDLALEDIPDYYSRKSRICHNCNKPTDLCQCEKPDHTLTNIEGETVTNEMGESVYIPYYVPKDFPIIVRKNTISDMTLLGGSDCERIRSQQQAVNKIESRILQKLLRSGVTPIMPEGTAITLSNAVFGQIIKTRPGESPTSYGTIDTTPDISQDIKASDRLYDHAKRVLGISDALQGLDNTKSESGYARELKIARSASRLETKKRMKQLAYCRLYELIFKHYLAFADKPRRFAFRDTLGRIDFSEFNRYDFIEEGDGGYYYDDSYLFTVDERASQSYQSEELWQTNLVNLEKGTLGDRESPETLLRYWQLQDKAHFPNARENVEYFQDIINRKKQKTNTITESEIQINE